MVPTLQIRQALLATLQATGLLEKVIAHSDSDLGAALEHLRDEPSALAVIVPGADQFTHEFIPGTNEPIYTEVQNDFEVLITARQLEMSQSGADASLTLKDAVVAKLLWSNLGIPDIVCMPSTCEPLALQFDGGRGREAWKLTLTVRHLLIP